MRALSMTVPRLVLVLSTMLSMLLVTAAPALASDVDLENVRTVCSDGVPSGLSYTVRLVDRIDETDSATALIEYRPVGLDADAFSTAGTLELHDGNSFQASGVADGLDFAGADRVEVRVTITDSDNAKVAGDSYRQIVDVTECGGGSGSGAFANFVVCGPEGTAPAALLGNDGDETLTYDVRAETGGEVFERTVDVEPNRTNNKRVVLEFPNLDSLEGRTIDLTVTHGDAVELQRSFEVDCDDVLATPKADILGDCTSQSTGEIVALLDNPTDAPVDYDLVVDGTVVGSLTVPAESTDQLVETVEDGTYEVEVRADGQPIARNGALVIDCVDDPEPPSVDARTECLTDVATIDLTLSNPDVSPATFVVTIDGTEVDTITVTGGSEVASYAVADGDYDVVVTADGDVVFDEVVSATCVDSETPQVDAVLVCDDDGGVLTVTVSNPGEAATAVLTIDGVTVATQTIPADTTTEMVAGGIEDGTRAVVLTMDGEVVHEESVEVDCVEVQGVVFEQDPPTDPAPTADPAPTVAGGQLPNAGVQSIAWVLFALLLVFFGGDLVLTELRTRLRRR